MKHVLPCIVLATVGTTLSTDYAERSFRVEVTTTLETEATSSIERNGEPMEGRGGGDRTSEMRRELVMIDEVLATEDGRPTVVRRTFDTLEGSTSFQFGDRYGESQNDTPLAGSILEIRDEDGEVVVEMVEGDQVDDTLLEGHLPTLSLDALLPEDSVEVGDSWELDSEAVLRSLGFDVATKLYAAPEREEGGEGRGGRRGRGAGGGGQRGGGAQMLFTTCDWDATATLSSETEEIDGLLCQVVEIEMKGEGELPEREPGAGDGRRGGRAFSLSPTANVLENAHEIELEGQLFFSVEDKRPVLFRIGGTLHQESEIERSRGDMNMRIETTQDGTFEHTVRVSLEVSEDE